MNSSIFFLFVWPFYYSILRMKCDHYYIDNVFHQYTLIYIFLFDYKIKSIFSFIQDTLYNMSYLFINQVTKINTKDNSLPITDSYADAILRTFASLTPSSSSKLSISRKSRRSHQFLSTVSTKKISF